MSVHEEDKNVIGSWITSRPDIKILDCTVRDGGLINNHRFDDTFVKAVYAACVAAGVNYMELGYKASKKIFSPGQYGAWKFCDEESLRRIVGENRTALKLCAMADAERTDYHTDILPKEQSVLDCIRIATYIHQIPTTLDMIQDAHDKGYETSVNLMAVSIIQDRELFEALEAFAKSPVDAIYVVDSFGALFPKQVRDFTVKFMKVVEGTGKEIGIHAHNNQQLAYANTIDALIYGASRLDATISGFGRGAGNCPLELLLGFLKNPRFDLRPVLECIQKEFIPLHKTLDWGYSIPYMLSGQLNQHPREAIQMRAGQAPDDYVAFYDHLMEAES